MADPMTTTAPNPTSTAQRRWIGLNLDAGRKAFAVLDTWLVPFARVMHGQ